MNQIVFNDPLHGMSVSEPFQVINDVNIHVECEGKFNLLIEQKTSGNKFVKTCYIEQISDVFEVDIVGKVFPKEIKVTCFNVKNKPVGNYVQNEQ